MLYKNTFKKIKNSFGRYISLLIIVMVGVGFYAGIQASAPDMTAVADNYYKSQNLMDFKIVSTMGLTDDDVNSLKALKDVKAIIPSYSLDVLAEDKAIRVHAIEESVNMVKLIEGRMPQTHNECVADDKTYKIGDKIKITSDVSEKLKDTDFTVVGTVASVLYLSEDYGSTTIGDGRLLSFVFISRDNFVMEAYSEIYLVAAGTENSTAYSKSYDNITSKLNDVLVKIKPDREKARYQEIFNKANDEIIKNETKLKDEKAKAEKEFTDAKVKLDENSQKLKDGKDELAKNESDLSKMINKQNADFEIAKGKIADGWNKINSALEQNGIQKSELDSKIDKLNTALQTMKTQLSQLPSDSQEYTELNIQINQYTVSYQGLTKLKESIDTLSTQEAELNKGIETFNTKISNAKSDIKKGSKEMADNEKKLNDGYKEYYDNLEKFKSEISDSEAKISDAKKKLSDMETTKWIIFDRDAAIGYTELKAGIDVISSVAAVFPLFFILIVMLMTSNSMARMIAEERGELGTLTSLGYKDTRIINTYLLYVLSASGLGSIMGFYIGCKYIPPLIYSTFEFLLPPIVIRFDLLTFLILTVVSLTLMTLVTLIACNRELKHKPATLMRPVPPKNGQTILLEKVGLIWKNLSFTWKVTMRNMFRYKKRAFMTIIGVAGCTSLLLVGFGLRDSMNGVAEKQYGEIFRYSNMIILKDDTQKISEALEGLLNKNQVVKPLLIKQTAIKCESGKNSLNAFLIVPETEKAFKSYYDLKSLKDGTSLSLDDNGVIVSQKISEIFNAEKGDVITFKDADNNTYKLSVSDVAENYTSNYIYMNNALYNKVFGKAASYNTIVSNHNANEKTLAENLINSGSIVNVVFTKDVMQKALDNSESLNSIIILIVVVASLLAIIVLYNLTSINISERTREISTLKVLGFRDGETNGYIYREAFILTLISIGVGMILGILLHRFVVGVMEGDSVVYFKKIKWLSFALSCLITLVFSLIMQVVNYFKLKSIDMIESLKSVE